MELVSSSKVLIDMPTFVKKIKQQHLIFTIITIILAAIGALLILENQTSFSASLGKRYSNCEKSSPAKWNDAPDLSILCRLNSANVPEFYNMFLMGYHLYWPTNQWANSDLVVVLDHESEVDHRMGTVLANLPPFPRVFYEKPSEKVKLCKDWMHPGHARQQYSYFYSDFYTEKEFIAIVESDSMFVTNVIPENLFVDGKPRLYGYNGCCHGWDQATKEAAGGDYKVGEFMVVVGFPVMVKRQHLKPLRDHITKQMNASSFEEAFHKICTKYPEGYSQIDIMAQYLWFNKRDEYSWHIVDSRNSNHPYLRNLATDNEHVLKMNRPIQGVMKSTNHHHLSDFIFRLAGDYLCVATKNTAGSCKSFFSDDLFNGTFLNLFVDFLYKTPNWDTRNIASPVSVWTPFLEIPWSVGNFTYNETYKRYQTHLNRRGIFPDRNSC